MSRKLVAFLITILIIVVLSIIGVGITYILKVTNIDSTIKGYLEQQNTVSYTTVTTVVSSPVSSLDNIQDIITPVNPTTSKLTSDVLKLSFNYQNLIGSFSVLTNKKGNRISIKSAEQSEDISQYIELYSKKPEETFEQAVNRVFLDGVPSSFCRFEQSSLGYTFEYSNYALGQIVSGSGIRPEQCPTPFTNNPATGTRFFIYDSNFPDRFGFVFVGNTSIPGTTKQTSWFESLQFIQ